MALKIPEIPMCRQSDLAWNIFQLIRATWFFVENVTMVTELMHSTINPFDIDTLSHQRQVNSPVCRIPTLCFIDTKQVQRRK